MRFWQRNQRSCIARTNDILISKKQSIPNFYAYGKDYAKNVCTSSSLLVLNTLTIIMDTYLSFVLLKLQQCTYRRVKPIYFVSSISYIALVLFVRYQLIINRLLVTRPRLRWVWLGTKKRWINIKNNYHRIWKLFSPLVVPSAAEVVELFAWSKLFKHYFPNRVAST